MDPAGQREQRAEARRRRGGISAEELHRRCLWNGPCTRGAGTTAARIWRRPRTGAARRWIYRRKRAPASPTGVSRPKQRGRRQKSGHHRGCRFAVPLVFASYRQHFGCFGKLTRHRNCTVGAAIHRWHFPCGGRHFGHRYWRFRVFAFSAHRL